ncbi:NAD-dependent epimerase/dehydratase [Sorangium cellulosum So ce56]|uniref:NAD-dependent epimerase/dehydratase n=1 Tax=Sorangium cellulosum (strain So ce56) TaxID=448385 RepID=A9FVU6_SORC5|nr:NAD-dependent epimerase/dehydratase family protein [Sorangium cellulosum]CAN92313.1 NAD-dependent epimerase/dehydratase [Sorangium cellulosum So ce56]
MAETVFVTGGSGFVGRAIVRALIAREYRVRALARSAASAAKLAALGAEPVRGDLHDAAALTEGCTGAAVVVHAAASLTSALRWGEHARTNVEGTGGLLAAARAAGVRRFIYLGAASVVIEGSRPSEGDEDGLPPRVDRSLPYSATKALAEAMVLEADSPAMRTVSLRPPMIWGPDAQTLDIIAEAFRAGRFAYVGGGKHLYSVAHVDNVAEAVSCAVRSDVGGRAYFVTDDEVTPMRTFLTELMATRGVDAKAWSVPFPLAVLFGWLLTNLFGWFAPRRRPPLTLEDVRLLGQTLHLSSARAKKEIGYRAVRSRAEGLAALRAHGSAVRRSGESPALAH